ncbi:MAG: hypothetical protein QOG84_938 [Sphingomonadales bacterium]|nr:hypothetical protein [Sphingomonadales bacterium]
MSGKTDHRGSTFLRKRDGTTITYSFDGLDRSIQKNVPASSGGAAAYSVSYKYDLRGLQTEARFGSLSGPGISSNDSYASNTAYNVSRSYGVNGLNQYTTAGGASFQYDLNGNLTNDGSNAYVYDAENRLVSASGGHSATLSYDPMGRLWQVASPTTLTRFLYDGDRLTIEYDGFGSVLRSYVHGPGADEPLVWYEAAGGATWRRYLHADHQGSIVAVADQNGNPIAINGYDAWGIPNSGNVGRFGYTGQAWLPELGMWYYKARIYSPTLGRFLQTDPVGYKDQMNLYAYVGNDPVDGRDPTGLLQCVGDDRCAAVHEAAASARGAAINASGELKGLASAIKSGSDLTPQQSSLRQAFEKKFGSASISTLNRVADRLDNVAAKIGVEGAGDKVKFTGPMGTAAARAPMGGDVMLIGPRFFDQDGGRNGLGRDSIILHEAGHSAGLKDRNLPDFAPAGIGRMGDSGRGAYGVAATDWLGANDPSLALKNNDNYNCFALPTCGGP